MSKDAKLFIWEALDYCFFEYKSCITEFRKVGKLSDKLMVFAEESCIAPERMEGFIKILTVDATSETLFSALSELSTSIYPEYAELITMAQLEGILKNARVKSALEELRQEQVVMGINEQKSKNKIK